jgi:hypothetical protein
MLKMIMQTLSRGYIVPTTPEFIHHTVFTRPHHKLTQRNITFSGIFYEKIIKCPENNSLIQFYAANTTLSPCLYNGSNKVHRTYSGETCTLYILNAFPPLPNFGPQHNIYFLSSHKYQSCSICNCF